MVLDLKGKSALQPSMELGVFWKVQNFNTKSQTDLQADVCTGHNHVVVLDDHVRAEPAL